MDIISAYRQVGSYRAAAELCGTTHKTVKRVVERTQAGGTRPGRARRSRNYDCVTELVADRVGKSGGRISAERLLPVAWAAGYQGSARNFRRLVAEQKALWRTVHLRGSPRAVWSPGEYLMIDWARVGTGLHMFCAVLAFSRWRFVRFAVDQRATTTLSLIAEALAAIGGVPARVLAGRMGCLKGGVVANVVVPTADYARLSAHYGFKPHFCLGADPEWKGIVKYLCGYGQSDLLVRLLTDAEVSGRPLDIHTANAAATAWCVEINAAMHSETMAVPDEWLGTEHDLLAPLPSLPMPIGPPSVTRKVDRLSCVRYGSARYSVPSRLIGARVRIVIENNALLVVEPATGATVAQHELVTPGVASTRDAHYDAPRPLGDRSPRPTFRTEQQFCAPSEDTEAVLVGAADTDLPRHRPTGAALVIDLASALTPSPEECALPTDVDGESAIS